MEESPDITIAGDDDLPEIVSLFNRVFGMKRDLDDWKRQYGPTPAGMPRSYLVRSTGDIIGHLGVIPVKYRCEENEARGAQLVDYMVDPDWARRGYGTALREVIVELLADDFDFAMGYANRISHAPAVAAGLTCLGRANVYLKRPKRKHKVRLDIEDGGALRGGDRGLESLLRDMEPPVIEETGCELALVPLDQLDDMEAAIDGPALWHHSHDPDTMRWRYGTQSKGYYAILGLRNVPARAGYGGIVVLASRKILGRDTGVIVDIWTSRGCRKTAGALIAAAVDIFSRLNSRLIACLFTGSGPEARALRRNGFLRFPQQLSGHQLNLVFRPYGDFEVSPEQGLKPWYLTWGDTDLV